MLWYELYDKEHEPSGDQVLDFVNTSLWSDLAEHLQQIYNIKPKLSYSGCSMDGGIWKGWNVKYKKSGKALCSLYPKEGYFLALIAVGNKDITEAELLIPLCDKYTQDLWNRTKSGHIGKSLAFEVTREDIVRDIKNLIALRTKS